MTRRASRAWSWGLLPVVLWLGAALSINIDRPWTGHHDWNGAVWAQSAHNNLRAGLGTTVGVPTGYYFGPLPIPPEGYYVHHPPGLPLAVTGMFALFGEREWAARLVPIACSLVSVVLLWLLVRSFLGVRAATLAAGVFALLPMELYFGRMVNHEPAALMWMLASALCLRFWSRGEGRRRWAVLFLVCLVAGMWTAWTVYIWALVLTVGLAVRGGRAGRRLALGVLVSGLVSMVVFLLLVRSVRPDAWADAWAAVRLRARPPGGAAGFTWGGWLGRQWEYLGSRIPLPAWGLAAAGAVLVVRARRRPRMRRLGALVSAFSLTAGIYVVGFPEASYIHDYSGFYFIAPVAMAAGVTLDVLLRKAARRRGVPFVQGACLGVTVAAVVLLGLQGYRGLRALHRIDWWILDGVVEEPRDLIPRLGRTIYWTFPDRTRVLCNFSARGPHLEYYARRSLLYDRFTYEDWAPVIKRLGGRVGGVVWLGAPGGDALWSALPGGNKKVVRFNGLRFGLWRPAERPAPR